MRIIALVLVCVLCSYVAAENGNSDLADRLKALEDERAQLEAEINLYREKAKHLLDIFRDVLKDDDTESPSDEPITKRQIACNTATSQVVFHTRLLRQKEFATINEDIVFDIVHTNIGGGYNSSTGIFTAPRQGNYQLMASTMATDGNSTDVRMVRSSHYPYTICSTHAGTSHSSMGLCVAFVTLEENENVRVEHYHRSHQVIAGGKFSSFSGHLINDN
ncbi:uncharacterized protein LOC117334486 [Pecten maximus]|uniref:uncharacterized protein LOC117334486 n=1 Tax=Pecten maximus TaxID=6579 RepID=UPI00145863FF|nr:uncharacterized protein LOC117334486 [Pecten maximus]